jgi:hypothetical protein
MKPKEKAISLVDSYRIILMNSDTECGEEILCTVIAKQCALIAVDEIIRSNPHSNPLNTNVESTMEYWQQVKQKIQAI